MCSGSVKVSAFSSPFSVLFVVALELVFRKNVIRNDVISLTQLVPLGYEYKECEESKDHHGNEKPKHTVTMESVAQYRSQNDKNAAKCRQHGNY